MSITSLSKVEHMSQPAVTQLHQNPTSLLVAHMEARRQELGIDEQLNREHSSDLRAARIRAAAEDLQDDVDDSTESEAPKLPFKTYGEELADQHRVPVYNPTMRKTTLWKYLDQMGPNDLYHCLRARGYPAHWLHDIQKSMERGVAHARLRQLSTIERRSEPVLANTSWGSHPPKQSVQFKKFVRPVEVKADRDPHRWRIPYQAGAPLVPKPLPQVYSHRYFRAWVLGVSAQLHALLSKKTQFVTGNEACRQLYSGRFIGRVADRNRLLAGAAIYIDDYNNSGVKNLPPTRWLSEHLPEGKVARSVRVFGRELHSVHQLTDFAVYFAKHRPLFKLCQLYLSGTEESPIDPVRLQAGLTKAFGMVELQGQAGSKLSHMAGATEDMASAVRQFSETTHQVQVHHSFDLSDTMNQLALATGYDGDASQRTVAQVVFLFGALGMADSWASVALAIGQFCAGNETVWRQILKLLPRVPSSLTFYQGGLKETFLNFKVKVMEAFSEFTGMWTAIVSAITLTVTQAVLPATFEMFVEPILSVVRATRGALLHETGATIAKSIISGMTEVLTRVKRAVEERNFAPLWGSAWDPRRWIREVEGLITFYPALTSQGPDPNNVVVLEKLRKEQKIPLYWTEAVPVAEYLARADVLCEQGQRMLSYFSEKRSVVLELSMVLRRFKTFLDSVQTAVTVSNTRMAPYMIFLTGEPGGGKTNMARTIAKAIGEKHGYDVTPAGTYDYKPNVNFHDNFDHTKWCVQMDDIDQGVAPPAAGFKTHAEVVLEMVNNSPMSVEQAAVDMKGKIKANPLLVIYCTNFSDARLDRATLAPNAFWRRVGLNVKVRAKAAFSKGNGILDPAKVQSSETYDMYDLQVSWFDPQLANTNSGSVTPPFSGHKTVSFGELMCIIHDGFEKKLSFERQLLSQRARQGTLCKVCYLDTTEKSCGHEPSVEKVAGQTEYQGQTITRCRRDPQKELKSIAIGLGVTVATQVYGLENPLQWKSAIQRMDQAVSFVEQTLLTPKAAAVAAGVLGLYLIGVHQWYNLQARETNAMAGLVPETWVRAHQEFKPGVPPSFSATYTKDDLEAALRTAHVLIRGPEYEVHGFLCGHNSLVCPSHAVEFGKEVKIVFPNRVVILMVTPMNCRALSGARELVVIRCGELKGTSGLVKKCWPVVDQSYQQFDEVELWSDKLEYSITKNVMRMVGGERMLTTNAPTKSGDCGMVYVARVGSSWRIVAMHYALIHSVMQSATMGALLCEQTLELACTQLGTTYQGVRTVMHTMSKNPKDVVFSRFPNKSEVWVAMSEGAQVYPLGELYPPLAGSKMVSKMQISLVAQEFLDFQEKVCGRVDYWRFPEFRGRMEQVGDHQQWVSPWTKAFSTQNHGQLDEQVMFVAMADYLAGIQELDTSGYATISEKQAVVGIAGSYIHSVNMLTSAGPPFSCGKRNHIAFTDEEVAFSPEMALILDEIEACLERGDIPATVGLCTLKDEPVKPGKAPRVFTNLSAAFNLVCKRYFSSVKSFMRANFAFFESAVGVNMTSGECNKIIQKLMTVDPDLHHLYDGDAKALDKSWCGALFDFVAMTWYAIGFTLGVDPVKIFLLVHAVKHTRFAIKSDIFQIFWNPSGHDATVEFNGTVMSLGERYVYYRTRMTPELRAWATQYAEGFMHTPLPVGGPNRFRHDVALVHYGDDNVKASVVPLVPNYEEIWLNELGISMTDAAKEGRFRAKKITEIQFLKRKFVWDDELSQYIPPLDLKSIARMVYIKRESQLTLADHACIAMTEAMREMVYHGRDAYDDFLVRVDRAVEKHDLQLNANLDRRSWDEWRQVIKDGGFRTWVVRGQITPSEWF